MDSNQSFDTWYARFSLDSMENVVYEKEDLYFDINF